MCGLRPLLGGGKILSQLLVLSTELLHLSFEGVLLSGCYGSILTTSAVILFHASERCL